MGASEMLGWGASQLAWAGASALLQRGASGGAFGGASELYALGSSGGAWSDFSFGASEHMAGSAGKVA
jgi:hypothetical protein